MSLDAILLGLLDTPKSGYELKKELESGLAHFWSVNLSQIYPALKKMTKSGLLNSETAAPESGPSRVIYQRTDAGRNKVIEWLQKGPIDTAERLHHLAQTYLLYELKDDDSALIFLQKLLSKLTHWQEKMDAIDVHWRQGHGAEFFEMLPDEDFFPYLTLDLGLRKNQANIDWCKDCIAHVEKRKSLKT
jgi:DNA-binding PadR family transcriptional regulator